MHFYSTLYVNNLATSSCFVCIVPFHALAVGLPFMLWKEKCVLIGNQIATEARHISSNTLRTLYIFGKMNLPYIST